MKFNPTLLVIYRISRKSKVSNQIASRCFPAILVRGEVLSTSNDPREKANLKRACIFWYRLILLRSDCIPCTQIFHDLSQVWGYILKLSRCQCGQHLTSMNLPCHLLLQTVVSVREIWTEHFQASPVYMLYALDNRSTFLNMSFYCLNKY